MQTLMSEGTHDQAAGLRRLMDPQPVRVIAVASGKGGVGKTNVSVNLSVALANRGKEVMLLDADLAMANVDVLLGLQPRADLSSVLDGSLSLEEIVMEGPSGVHIVPASSGVARLAALGPSEHAGLIRAFSELPHALDVMVVDIAAGVSDSVISFSRAAHDVVVVVCDEPASITDAYALVKVLSREHGLGRFQILANMVRSEAEGQALYRKISTVCERFLDVTLRYMGSVPQDEYLRKAVQKQNAVVAAYPGSPSAKAFKKLAQQADNWPVPDGVRGHLEFFVERLVQSGGRGR
jgi:flagellar biosynthesis protein FlhG